VEFQQVVTRRRMVRRYRDEPVAADVLERVVATALRGPSAGFSQGLRLVVVTEEARRAAIAAICGEAEHVAKGRDPWLSVAPVHIIACVREGDYRQRYAEADKDATDGPDHWSAPYWWVDGGAGVMLLLLAAVEEGLGAGILDLGDTGPIKDLLGIPDDVSPICLVTVGHPADDPGPRGSAARGRRAAAETVHWQTWRAPT
jgi:nitroreductase